MAFQPFGYEFDIRSRLSPAQAKAAIRERKKDWFEPADGARGWIAGSFICLWFSAYDSQGPMLFGWISPHGSGTRISGRAGSDLNGLAFVAPVLLAIVLSMAISMIVAGDHSPGTVRTILFLVVLLALGLWFKHIFRKEAQPLVHFVEAAVADEASKRAKSPVGPLKKHLTLSVAGEKIATPVTTDAIERALLDVGAGGFLVLAVAEEIYLQTASRDADRFIIEWRDGAVSRHFRAVRSEITRGGGPKSDLFSFDEVLLALTAFATDTPMPVIVAWKPATPGARW